MVTRKAVKKEVQVIVTCDERRQVLILKGSPAIAQDFSPGYKWNTTSDPKGIT